MTVYIIPEPSKRERDRLMEIAIQRHSGKRKSDQILGWHRLLEWARLGGKTEEVTR